MQILVRVRGEFLKTARRAEIVVLASMFQVVRSGRRIHRHAAHRIDAGVGGSGILDRATRWIGCVRRWRRMRMLFLAHEMSLTTAPGAIAPGLPQSLNPGCESRVKPRQHAQSLLRSRRPVDMDDPPTPADVLENHGLRAEQGDGLTFFLEMDFAFTADPDQIAAAPGCST